MCASSKQRLPTTCGINQGLHASVVAFAHRPAAGSSANFYTHLTWPVHFWQSTSTNRRRHRPGDIGRGLPTSVVGYSHRSANIDRGQPRICPDLCTSLSKRQPWTSRIALGLHTMVSLHRTLPARISLGLHTMVSRRRMGLPLS